MRKSEILQDADRRHSEGRRERRAGAGSAAEVRREQGDVLQVAASVSDMKRLRELQAEKAKLKRMSADLALPLSIDAPAHRLSGTCRNWGMLTATDRATSGHSNPDGQVLRFVI